MNVADLQTRILALSHDEVAPTNDLKAQSLKWLNSAYHELWDDLLPWLGESLQTEEGLTTDATGAATLSGTPYRVQRVYDITNGRKLLELSREQVLDLDPTEADTGAPIRFYINSATIQLYPKSAVSLKVFYLPAPNDLSEDDAESAIAIPRQFHHGLIWGALVWGSVYERGFATQADLTLFQRKWDEAKQSTKLALAHTPSNPTRTMPYRFID